MAGAFVYIVKCSDSSYYTGVTKQAEPEARVWEHNNKIYEDAYTSKRLPVELVYAEYFDLVMDAATAERKIKGWSRVKKEAMMRGDWQAVVELAKRRGGKPKL